MRRQIRAIHVVALAVAGLGLLTSLSHAGTKSERSSSRPISKLSFDAAAESVEFFKGMEDGVLETKVIATGPMGGSLLITNHTDQPLTVEMPQAFVTVHVLKQFGGMGGGGGGMGGGGMGGGQGGGQGGGNQNQGGGMGGGGQGGGGMGGGGMGGGGQGGGGGAGFFSIPPEKTVRVPYVSVCLEHGKADPTPRATYKIVPVEEYTKDPVLQEMISMVGSGKLPPQGAQAAVWTRTDNLSWHELASKFSYNVLGGKIPYFSGNELRTAQVIVSTAEGRVREKGDSPANEAIPVRTRVR